MNNPQARSVRNAISQGPFIVVFLWFFCFRWFRISSGIVFFGAGFFGLVGFFSFLWFFWFHWFWISSGILVFWVSVSLVWLAFFGFLVILVWATDIYS